MSPLAIIISDVHLGSPYFMQAAFERFLDALPAGSALVLNGDVLDAPGQALPPAQQALLDRVVAESATRPVIWVCGNHDEPLPATPASRWGAVRFVPEYAVGQRLVVVHGHDFDRAMRRHRWFFRLFRWLHEWRIRLGAPPVHVAYYAKKVPVLYGILRRNVRANAVAFAAERGFPAVACGHVHAVEDSHAGGVRYLNTGAWTEPPATCVVVEDAGVRLRAAAELPDIARRCGR